MLAYVNELSRDFTPEVLKGLEKTGGFAGPCDVNVSTSPIP